MRNKRVLLSILPLLLMSFSFTNFYEVILHKSETHSLIQSEKDYNSLWAKVDSLESMGLTRSALEVVEVIYKNSKKENVHPQFIKSVFYKLKYANYIEENSQTKIANDVKKEIRESVFPTNAILKTILAGMYWQYYKDNRYKYQQRTETVNFDNEDFLTWDLNRIVKEITKYYLEGVSEKEKLQNISIKTFEDILDYSDTQYSNLRPTLYDVLTHEALTFLISEESSLTQPVYRFQLDTQDDFSEAKDFIKINYSSKDSLSLKFYAIQLYQKLIEFHLSKGNKEALIDIDVARLNFVLKNSIHREKREFYFSSLQELTKHFIDIPHSSIIWYNIAKFYSEEAKKYDYSVSDEHKLDNKRALEICDSIITKFPETYGSVQCDYLRKEIQQKAISFEVENANIPNQPFRALVSYKNINKIYLRVVPWYGKLDEQERYSYRLSDRQMDSCLSLKPIKEWSINLPAIDDYQNHSVEIKIPALPTGNYMIFAGTDSNFSYQKNAIAHRKTWVTNISYLERELKGGLVQLSVLDRKTGHSIPNVTVTVYDYKYNYSLRQHRLLKTESGVTKTDGSFEYDLSKYNYNQHKIVLEKDDDRFESGIMQGWYSYNTDKIKKVRTDFFLDRGIYRPGQTIYFKGLIYETDNKKEHKILPGTETTVTLYDANHQKISDTTLTTNEYGTFNGQFQIPYGKIGGSYRIADNRDSDNISHNFRVEEYKRPKFEIKFEPVTGSYALNEKVKVTGIAKTFSGANLNDVEVKYRVIRHTSFPYYHWRWRNYYGWCGRYKPPTEIVNGVTKTDAEGRYTVEFEAVPDLSILRETNPQFNYTIYADLIDVTGETHSVQTNVSVGYVALTADIEIPELVNAESENKFKVLTQNLNGSFEPAQVSIEVYKLKSPERVFRNRLWNQPDVFLFSKDEYYNEFTHDIYNDEDQFYKWDKESKVFESNFLTTENYLLEFEEQDDWLSGKYLVLLKTEDKNGIPVELNKYFTLFQPDSKTIPLNEACWSYIEMKEYEPGDIAKLYLGSALKNVKVHYELEQDGKLLDEKWIELNDEQKVIEIEIEEEHRGNITAHTSCIINNQSHIFTNYIFVPWTNKKLKIEFETFRNKLIPGLAEEWKLKITGPEGDVVAAEMLASMYDVSLDKFWSNNWWFNIQGFFYPRLEWNSGNSFELRPSYLFERGFNEPYLSKLIIPYPELNRFGFSFDGFGYKNKYIYTETPKVKKKKKGKVSLKKVDDSGYLESSESLDEVVIQGEKFFVEKSTNTVRVIDSEEISRLPVRGISTTNVRGGRGDDSFVSVDASLEEVMVVNFDQISVRKNLNETAFFYPELMTNEDGEVIISFTSPEALTRWKFQAFAHTHDLKSAIITAEAITQKDLMIQPNPPRFLREGDEIFFTAKVSNLADDSISGFATLKLFDAFTMKPVDELFENVDNIKSFSAETGMSVGLSWRLKIPLGKTDAIVCRVMAKSGDFSDGEENSLPILPNRMLLTETLPLSVNGNKTKSFILDKLMNNTSTTLQNYNLTLEFTSNPAWYAIQALPYLMEFPHECSEQTFSRFYANSIASHIANSNPKIKKVFESWKTVDKDALLSNLEKNQELKYALLEETPWVLNAQNESERKRRIGLLFDLTKMSEELNKAEQKLKQSQYSNGGWSWFPGLPESRYITQHIVNGFGHLDKLGVKNVKENPSTWEIVKKAVLYTDLRMSEDYEQLKFLKLDLNEKHLNYITIQYLYGRSYFLDIPVDKKYQEAFDYWKEQAEKYWLNNNKYMQGMIALALNRMDDTETAKDIVKSIIENAVFNDELGMYFKEEWGWYWYQAPIETQALLIEAVSEIVNDQTSVDLMKTWLLKQKQVQDWKTTKATAEACYALLLRGADWLAETKLPEIKIGGQMLQLENNPAIHVEKGTGYFKTSWKGDDIKPEMSNVTVTNNNSVVSWGSLYWQYFEQLDKITPSETPIKINKKLFLEIDSETGKKISPITDSTKLKPGDRIKVRIEIRVDRDMEFVHLKDMRASGFEPVNVLSTHKYQDGLWYYENTRDAATNFFMDRLLKGTYVFEYPLIVNHKGDFSNGITSIQCMYAPEFTSHSEGVRVKVE